MREAQIMAKPNHDAQRQFIIPGMSRQSFDCLDNELRLTARELSCGHELTFGHELPCGA
jgi:hypothetical protein